MDCGVKEGEEATVETYDYCRGRREGEQVSAKE